MEVEVVKNAFLHGEVDKEIFMEQPRGFEESPNYVCRLKRPRMV